MKKIEKNTDLPLENIGEQTTSEAQDHAVRLNSRTKAYMGFWKRHKARTHDDENRYSAVKEAKTAVRDFSSTAEKHKGIGGKVLAVLGFIGHMIHILLRTIWRLLLVFAVTGIACGLIVIAALGAVYFSSSSELPNVEDYTQVKMPQDSTIYDCDGEVIGVVSTVSRENIGFGEISQPMKDAIVSIEDERFYNHSGIDFQGIARALYVNFQEWRSGGSATSQGASTITQQYVRNAYSNVGTEQTVSRKLTEMMLAAQLEATMSKDDILNSYLNTVYFGNGCYGIEAASKHYFGHSASTLSYYEAAVLAAVVNGPSIYNPETEEGREKTAQRANLVIDKMYSLGYLGDMAQEDIQSLKATDLVSTLHITESERRIDQPFYYDYVVQELGNSYSQDEIEAGGWQIYTTLSIADGKSAEEVIKSIEKKYSGKGITGAIVDCDISTGAIHAFCGGTDYSTSQYNIATMAHLQTGSTLKPLIYGALCEYKGYYMSDKMTCTSIDIGTSDSPHVITPYLSGSSATLKQGIIASDNAMTIHVAKTLGMENVQKALAADGIKSEIENNLVVTIGGQSNGLVPLELASAYTTVARGGQEIDYWCVSSIVDSLGNEVYKHEEAKNYAMSEEVSLQVIDAMKAAVDEAGWYNIPFDKEGWTIAAKTGTTNDDCDSWCVGFDHDRSVALWVGGKDSRITVSNASYNTTTAFSSYFEKVGQGDSKADWDKPAYKTLVPDKTEEQSLEEYQTALAEKQLTMKVEYVTVNNTTDDTIIGVSNAGQYIARGDAAIVQVAKDMVTVPSFVNMTPEAAYKAGEKLKLTYKISYSTSASAVPVITEQSVKAGEVVTNGTEVVLAITILIDSNNSSATTEQVPVIGNDTALQLLQKERDSLKTLNDQLQAQLDAANSTSGQVTVPNLSGLTTTEAKQVLTSLGLKTSYTGGTTENVTSTSPSYGSKVSAGSTVTLKTSSSNSNSNSNTNTNSNTNKNSNGNNNSNFNKNANNDNED